MNKKKTLLVVLAMMLVCVMSVVGTLAYLNATTTAVTNTFIAADGDDPFVGENGFTLKEYKVTSVADGSYTQDPATLVDANTYANVLPGTILPKTVVINIAEKNAAPAYLYVEVVNKLDTAVYTWAMDDNWELLTGVTGKNGGAVYVYTAGADAAAIITDDLTVTGVLNGNAITVADVEDLKLTDTTKTLTFYGYLSQSTINNTSDPAEVFELAF